MNKNIKYIKYLKKLTESYRASNRPISKEIMITSLSEKFNLSPESCRRYVNSLYK